MSRPVFGYLFLTALLTAVLTLILQQMYIKSTNIETHGNDLKDDAIVIQQAINSSFKNKEGLVKLTGNKKYVIRSGIVIKEGVTLELGKNTKILIDGNFRAIQLEKNATIINGTIEVIDPKFNSEVVFIDGKHKFWSWERTEVTNVSIINSSGSHKGSALSLYATGDESFISFVNFVNNKVAGFNNGIQIVVEPSGNKKGQSWINGNRFVNMTLDDCVNYIVIDSSVSIPNESSGNQFTGLQIQLSQISQTIIKVSGSYNTFQGMVWDQHLLNTPNKVVQFTQESAHNMLDMNIERFSIMDKGNLNSYTE
ncbi:hypothetical protein ABE65_019370 [Fictibacillus phosphorivorans]|uniref:Pectate lyase superfamily protein domain-containing protein n=1 Tax=Fictibacillus phosphorivorans TaxID=1221500 RepID=A0A160IS77_9BACL|nr:hypothetical protein [Fictibacillus phosphorivorans]ANC78842.1 hypothetical protein ABE65_019370 [Fictibacillus phosphorivorans]